MQRHTWENIHAPVFEDWVKSAWLAGVLKLNTLPAPGTDFFTWRPRGWSWVDPLKDTQANVLSIEKGLVTRSDILAERGETIEDVFATLAQEQELAKSFN